MAVATNLTNLEERLAGLLVPRRGTAVMCRGEGCWLWDSEGQRYLDLTSAHGVASLGHSHPALEEAIVRQSRRLIACSSSFYNDERSRFLGQLSGVLPPQLQHVFLSNSGTEAMEAALKFARLATGRHGLVALKRGFHGRTTGSLAVTWNPRFRKPFLPLLPEVSFVSADDVDSLERAVSSETAAVVVEVIQGEGGVHPCQREFLEAAQSLCRKRGALLVIDEIQTGCGRTGAWFAHQPLGLEPDILTLGKGIAGGFPMAATCSCARVKAALFAGGHGSTFGGNPLAASVGRATLETLEREGLPARAREQGEKLLAGLRDALAGIPVVREIRGRGLMVGIELRQKVAPYLGRLMEEEHVLALPAGPTVLRLLPALVIDSHQIELAIDAVAKVLGQGQ